MLRSWARAAHCSLSSAAQYAANAAPRSPRAASFQRAWAASTCSQRSRQETYVWRN